MSTQKNQGSRYPLKTLVNTAKEKYNKKRGKHNRKNPQEQHKQVSQWKGV